MFITLILIYIAGVANGIMDLIFNHWYKVPKWMLLKENFWNPEISWRNKWKIKSSGFIDPEVERFWGSSTIFVSLTDGWHLCKEIMLTSISIAFTINTKMYLNDVSIDRIITFLLMFIMYRLIFWLGFKTTYK